MKPTPGMIEAGSRMANDLVMGNMCKSMNGLGGGATWEEFKDKDVPNFELIQAYVDGEICSVEAMYTAMERAKEVEIPENLK